MLDEDLAEMYGVETKRLNEQVKRNIDRFPSDFMFQLTEEEYSNLRSQFATSSWGGRRNRVIQYLMYFKDKESHIYNSDYFIVLSSFRSGLFVANKNNIVLSSFRSDLILEFEIKYN